MEQRPGSFEFNGMLGQNVVIYPDMDMVLVTNAGNNELFQDYIMLNIIRKYFPPEYAPADTLPENRAAALLLKRLCGELEQGMELTALFCVGAGKNVSCAEITAVVKKPTLLLSLRNSGRNSMVGPMKYASRALACFRCLCRSSIII